MAFAITIVSALIAGGVGFTIGRRQTGPFSKKLNQLLGLSTDISSSVDQVSSVSSEISKASHEQLDTLNSTAAASHEIRCMVERTTESASHLHSRANHLRTLAESGNQAVNQMVASSHEIKNGMGHFQKEMQQSMDELTHVLKVIQEIATKTQVINEIVFQTKILSFNASVESARAGVAGKSFAVVAEEVGKLAQMSGSAANEISEIVTQSVAVVEQTINSTKAKIESLSKDTAHKSDLGFANAKLCEKTFHEMEEKIGETVQMIEQISAAAAEQAQGVAQLDQSIITFREAADRNRLVASQATEHSHEFKSQVQSLSTLTHDCVLLLDKKIATQKNYQKFIWNDRLELQVPAMDDEHKILVGKINNLVEALALNDQGENLANVKAAFSALAQYTIKHFADEENFMKSISYPQLNSHKKIHQKLLDQVGEFGQALENGTLNDTKLISFLRNWLISHIMGVDMQYSRHANPQNKVSRHAA